ncbi:Protein of unknown function DUF58 [Lutimaribacter pacificus]|uniref:DUF58 domain-containing protein n=1 Tax=Lutimaribacter pacificus TaxID=391948 RepID=A0A1H0GY21_9RHOB|nr:DUF58 domain-containing protein [Lutimaribacter pacificus]SDO11694.1 Protein of unknown function DUF58 [Lutimaribacter pacificus]SHJ93237.1 Protein of unknown function DUF58 [Lutimaribacter pacificus]
MTTPLALRARAEAEAARLPPLLARAEHLAGTVLLGEHGRRRAGLGDDFWQYRPAQPGDPAHRIDWRRSARGDQQFVREREWQIAQSVMLWVDRAASMRFSSDKGLPEKGDRARLLALALSVMLIRGGERVGLTGATLPPRRGNAQLERLAAIFVDDDASDYGTPEARGMIPHARAVFISDFMGDVAPVHAALTKAADRGVRGLLIQVLDPSEEAFPFQGRTVFESIGGTLSHETLKAGDLRGRYLQRLAARKDELAQLCRATGWQYHCHHTGDSAQAALLWAWRAMDQGAVR